jgi:uncharacterized protein (TIGR00661 family)
MSKRKKVLVAPLDWGMGHATRSIPIINELLLRDVEVVIGADNRPADLLKKEFPDLEHIRFPGYSVHYQHTGNLTGTIIAQLPAILNSMVEEHRYLDALIRLHSFDAVISDNRFGAFSRTVPSVILIHQLNIQIPPPLEFARRFVAFVNRTICNQFTEVWVPDFPAEPGLAGDLSHPKKKPRKTFYIGPLSRITAVEAEKEIDILVILSGPEPQRSIFEETILAQVKTTDLVSVIIRGKPEHTATMKVTPTITMINSATTETISRLIAASTMVISRPGHTTVMDLSFIGAQAIFIPTPHQTEQEYLARSLKERMIVYSEAQSEFNLHRALERSASYTGLPRIMNDLAVLRDRLDHLIGPHE